MMDDLTKNSIFTTNAIGANGQPTTIQYQTTADSLLKQPKIEGQKQDQQPTYYYTTTNVSKVSVVVNYLESVTYFKLSCMVIQR